MRDRLQHSIYIAQHIVVPEAKNVETVGGEHGRARRISTPSCRFHVLTAVQLDYETGLEAREVGEVSIDGMLPTKSETEKSPPAKLRPQSSFGIGGFAAEFSGESAAGRWDAHRARMRPRFAAGEWEILPIRREIPSPRPSPAERERGPEPSPQPSPSGAGRGSKSPHPNPLPAELGEGARALTPTLSRRAGEGVGALTPTLSQRSWERGQEPSPQPSPAERERGRSPHPNPLPAERERGAEPSPQPSPSRAGRGSTKGG